MRRNFLIFVFLLAACSTAPVLPPVHTMTATLVLPTQTASLAPSATPLSTETPAPPTVTALPTIPTFTPTFDARKIVTATPAPKAECPLEKPEFLPDFPYCDARGCSGGPYNDVTLNYLNSGGALVELKKKQWAEIADLTGDGLEEVVFAEFGKLFIYGCKNGRYEILYEVEGTQNTPGLDYIVDLNKNGIPELIVSGYERRAFSSIQIFEWNGSKFRSLIINYIVPRRGGVLTLDWFGGTALDYKITDRNKDGTDEIVAVEKIPYDPSDLADGLPWREETTTIGWNGQNFVAMEKEYTPPHYRFQAIQDADISILAQDYNKAMHLYQDTIFSDLLDWWSEDRKFYESKIIIDEWLQYPGGHFDEAATPIPTLPVVLPDSTEYPRLAAYAYYRMVILHTYLGETEAAQLKYATLQEKFPAGDLGHPYVEMATAFWDAYQSTSKMYDACAAAIAYADSHSEILVPLGSDYHGWQSHTYTPADVCPFR